ncbi:MAG: choice-of-anchor J domain-containing protein [Bacteroidales bacterium]
MTFLRLLYVLILLFLGHIYSFGQSQRVLLIEEFTQASCPACANINPTFNNLLNINSLKVIPLKYQVWWPGTDPMYNQNPSDVNTRVAYYNVSGVPDAVMDGNVFHGYPGSITQSMINTEYAVPSSFNIELSHQLNSTLDSVSISVLVTATEVVSGELRLFTVLTENRILFPSPPGTNGETEFTQVMRKMLPDANGSLLPEFWTIGQSFSLNFQVPVPDYYYYLKNFAVVAFIQSPVNKNVKQAVFSPPQLLGNDSLLDAGISGFSGLSVQQCSMPVGITATLRNYGIITITSASLMYQVDNGDWTITPWTGILPASGSVQVYIPDITIPEGIHTVKVKVMLPNGLPDLYPINNSKSFPLMYSIIGINDTMPEGFQATVFPPGNWLLNDIGTTGKTWTRTTSCGGFGGSTASARIPFYSMTNIGEVDELSLPPADLSIPAGAQLVFNVAYAQYNSSYIDKLKVMVSADCGITWTTVYEKQGSELATAPVTTSSFIPAASQWRSDTVDLSSFTGQPRVFIKFMAINGYGNNLYIDDVRIKHLYCRIQGLVTYKNSLSSPITNAVVGLYQNNQLVQSVSTNSSGYYQIDHVIPGNYQLKPMINVEWGGGNSVDALKILKHFTGVNVLSGLNAIAGNPDGNNLVNATDALWVSRRFVQLVVSAAVGDLVTEKPVISVSGLAPFIVNIRALCTGDVDGSYIP